MIKALLLIFSSEATWLRLAQIPRQWGAVLATYVLPMLLLVSVAEGYGMVHWGKPRGEVGKIKTYSTSYATAFAAAQFIESLALVLLAAKLLKSLGETFHGRHTFSQTFTVAAYGLSPYFLLRLLDAFPHSYHWLTWIVGILLAISVLYSGIPLILRPDPPHALGLYLMTSLFLLMITGLMCFTTSWFLLGKFGKLDAFIAQFLH
jgi:hypothetical protein